MADTGSLTAAILKDVLRAMSGGPPVLVATVIAAPAADAGRLGAKMLVRRDGSTVGSLSELKLDRAVLAESDDAFRRHGVGTVYLAADGTLVTRQHAGEAYELMLEVHEQPARLVVIGGGHVGKALSLIGSLCGFKITVVDDRPEYADAERFPEADDIVQGRFEDVLGGYPIDANSYVVCVTRGHKHDETSLRLVVGRSAAYVGMIGSKRRVGAVLQHLVEGGAGPEAVAAVHSPIGLDIGAETPEEIAVSIMAEIIQVRRGGSGEPMAGKRARSRRGVAPPERAAKAD